MAALLLLGAGGACTGIARLVAASMREAGAGAERIARSIALFDSGGLLHAGREIEEPFKREFALDEAALSALGLDPGASPTPVEMIRAMKPTVLVGATTRPGAFTQEMIEEMARHVERPIVLPLSNPTSRAECTPKDALDWSEFLAVQEDLYLRMMDIIAESGTGLAYPSQTLYLSRDQGLDAEKSASAVAEVKRWREQGRLPFPDFDVAFRQTHSDTLDYPPKGSSAGKPKPQG